MPRIDSRLILSALLTVGTSLLPAQTVPPDSPWRGIGVMWSETAPGVYHTVPGPAATMPGVALVEGQDPVLIHGTPSQPLVDRGTLMFWVRTDQAYRSGRDAVVFTQKLVELRDAFTISFIAEKPSLTLMVQWHGPREAVSPRHIRVILPELPGPAWHHIAVRWDGPGGESNVFLDGTPYHLSVGQEPPLPIKPATELVLHLDRFAFADFRLLPGPVSEKELRAVIGAEKWGGLDTLLGVRDYGPAPSNRERGKLLYHRALNSAADTSDWKIEGPAIIDYRDGWMHMRSERPNGPEGHLVHWCPVDFPARFRAEWDFELIDETGLCIVFFAAHGQGDRDLFDSSLAPRNGVFTKYTNSDIDCYHISYFANAPSSPRRVANLRKNSGFYLIANGPVGVTAGGGGNVHHAILVKDGARIRMAVDGRTIIDHTDDGKRAGPVWGAGKIGLRQMQWTNARYRDFRVYALP
jgi:hypothetical protein